MIEENHVTVKPDWSVATRGMKTYSAESGIELRNLEESAGNIKSVFVIGADL